jgi:hypothetical protein
LLCTALCTAAQAADDAPLPTGRWEAEASRLCVEIHAGGMLELSSQLAGEREPARLAGPHRARRIAADEWRVTVEVRWILQKTLGRCREYWYSERLAKRDLLGLTAEPGRPLTLVFRFSDQRKQLQICGAPKTCLILKRAPPSSQAPPADDVDEEIRRQDRE